MQAASRGSHVSFRHKNGYAVMQALIARGVIGDFRDPDILRFGLTPLYLQYEDIWNAVECLRDILSSGAFRDKKYETRSVVT
jgi:kynureninase